MAAEHILHELWLSVQSQSQATNHQEPVQLIGAHGKHRKSRLRKTCLDISTGTKHSLLAQFMLIYTSACSVPQMSSVLSVFALGEPLNWVALLVSCLTWPWYLWCVLCRSHPHHLILSALRLPSDKGTYLRTHVPVCRAVPRIWIFSADVVNHANTPFLLEPTPSYLPSFLFRWPSSSQIKPQTWTPPSPPWGSRQVHL